MRSRKIPLRIKHRELGGNGAEAYYTEHPRPATLALQPGLPNGIRESREVEGAGYFCRKTPKGGRKFCFAPRSEFDYDYTAISAIQAVVEDLRPGWIEEIRDAATITNETRWIANWCELSENVVVAVLLILEARGELPES